MLKKLHTDGTNFILALNYIHSHRQSDTIIFQLPVECYFFPIQFSFFSTNGTQLYLHSPLCVIGKHSFFSEQHKSSCINQMCARRQLSSKLRRKQIYPIKMRDRNEIVHDQVNEGVSHVLVKIQCNTLKKSFILSFFSN